MGLSYDNQAQATAAFDRQIAEARARGTARALAQQMMLFERNPDPHPERNVENPATAGVRIRILRPSPMHITVDEECKRHNQAVYDLRKP